MSKTHAGLKIVLIHNYSKVLIHNCSEKTMSAPRPLQNDLQNDFSSKTLEFSYLLTKTHGGLKVNVYLRCSVFRYATNYHYISSINDRHKGHSAGFKAAIE